MWTGKLLGRSFQFTIKHAWPLLVALVAFAPVDFALNHYHHYLFRNLKDFSGPLFLAPPLSVLLINLVYALFQALLYALIWSRLQGAPLTYKSFRDWLALRPAAAMPIRTPTPYWSRSCPCRWTRRWSCSTPTSPATRSRAITRDSISTSRPLTAIGSEPCIYFFTCSPPWYDEKPGRNGT